MFLVAFVKCITGWWFLKQLLDVSNTNSGKLINMMLMVNICCHLFQLTDFNIKLFVG